MYDRGSARRPWALSALCSGPHARFGGRSTPAGPRLERAGPWRGLAVVGAWVIGLADPALALAAPEEAAETATGGDEPGEASTGKVAGDGATAEPSGRGDAATEPATGDVTTEPGGDASSDDKGDATGSKTTSSDDQANAAGSKTASSNDQGAAADSKTASRDAAASATGSTEPAAPAPRPPRIDGTYLGGTALLGIGLVRVNDFDTDSAFATFGGTFTVGQMVFPWLGLGLHGGGGGGVSSKDGVRQRLGQGHLGVQFKFVPLPKRRVPLSLLASFGFGGGAVRQEGIAQRSGFGGAQFGAAVRYELFPWAHKRRPYRGGGFGLGPELGWVGFTPAAEGRPMLNVLYLALSATFYFGD